jgi:hypothetical protein
MQISSRLFCLHTYRWKHAIQPRTRETIYDTGNLVRCDEGPLSPVWCPLRASVESEKGASLNRAPIRSSREPANPIL